MELTDHLRHHRRHAEAHGAFGPGNFGAFAERAARFFGTPGYIIGQTCLVIVWVTINTGALLGWVHFDRYPYILLNLAFSTQAAYAAPLILLAQTRQAERDKQSEDADALHREEIANRQAELLAQNVALTQEVAGLTREVHRLVCVPTEKAL
ncbi:MAG: DUF1003 domain-containing protein [Gaiellaceae bacterium]